MSNQKWTCPKCGWGIESDAVDCDCGYIVPQVFSPSQQMKAVQEFTMRMKFFLNFATQHKLHPFANHRSDGIFVEFNDREWTSFEQVYYDPDENIVIPAEIFSVKIQDMEQWVKDEVERLEQARIAKHEADELKRQQDIIEASARRKQQEYETYLKVKAELEGNNE